MTAQNTIETVAKFIETATPLVRTWSKQVAKLDLKKIAISSLISVKVSLSINVEININR